MSGIVLFGIWVCMKWTRFILKNLQHTNLPCDIGLWQWFLFLCLFCLLSVVVSWSYWRARVLDWKPHVSNTSPDYIEMACSLILWKANSILRLVAAVEKGSWISLDQIRFIISWHQLKHTSSPKKKKQNKGPCWLCSNPLPVPVVNRKTKHDWLSIQGDHKSYSQNAVNNYHFICWQKQAQIEG